jgi:exoribonuclease R
VSKDKRTRSKKQDSEVIEEKFKSLNKEIVDEFGQDSVAESTESLLSEEQLESLEIQAGEAVAEMFDKHIIQNLILSQTDKEWIKFLKDRSMTADQFLKYKPGFHKKEIIEKLKKYGY